MSTHKTEKNRGRISVDKDRITILIRRKKIVFAAIVVAALLLLLGGVQSLIYFNKYSYEISQTSLKLQTLVAEKNSGELMEGVWDKLWRLGAAVSQDHEASLQLRTMLRSFNETVGVAPKETIGKLAVDLPGLKQKMPEFSGQLAEFESAVAVLHDIYQIDYESLIDSMQHPPIYLWPIAGILKKKSGYLRIAIYNRAMYLAQTGEMGTARVLLTGLHASAHDDEFLALVYFGLARLQWELFVERGQRENYFLAVNFLRQSIQADPQLMLARRLLDFLLSISQTNTFEPGQGDPAAPSEGQAGADPEVMPIF
jgi:hypothetical protein